jgi:hypothetical protein
MTTEATRNKAMLRFLPVPKNRSIDALTLKRFGRGYRIEGNSHKRVELLTRKSCFRKRLAISDDAGGVQHHSVVFCRSEKTVENPRLGVPDLRAAKCYRKCHQTSFNH